jgi:hypothetical protein
LKSQEFGNGARARRMYENLSEDEEEKEATVIKQNSKLNQGNESLFFTLSFSTTMYNGIKICLVNISKIIITSSVT